MLIQKTFHLKMSRELAKAKLSDLSVYYKQLSGMEVATVNADGMAHFEFRLPHGFRAEVDLAEVPGEHPHQILFRSCRGNVEVIGAMEFFEINPTLTEAVLTIDYTIEPLIFRAIDYFTHSVDQFFNQQLERVEVHFNQTHSRIPADANLRQHINGKPVPKKPV